MQFLKQTTKIDFMGLRRPFLLFSISAVVLSILLAVILRPALGIDFAGGTEIQVAFKEQVTTEQIKTSLKKMGIEGAEVVTFGSGESEYLIRIQAISPITAEEEKSSKEAFASAFEGKEVSRFEFSPGGDKLTIRLSEDVPIDQIEKAVKDSNLVLGPALEIVAPAPQEEQAENDDAAATAEGERAKTCDGATCTWPFQEVQVYEVALEGVTEQVMAGLRAEPFGKGAAKMKSEWVGPKVGKQLRNAGFWSLVYALAFIMLYIAIRFDVRFAPGAVVALIHDIIITLGIFTIFRLEVTLATIAALLTIVGYSLNDTIVVFDRIRENLGKLRERNILQVVNVSINETLSRTILTSITTLLAVAVMLAIAWNTNIRDFAIALLIGVLVGTYSSVFIASPVVVWLDKRFARKKA